MKHSTLFKLLCAGSAVAFSVGANAQGVISTVAGSGTSGFSGDGGLAISAQFSAPAGVATDGYGNLFVADKNNHRVRMINGLGYISTIAGNGAMLYGGMGGPALLASMEYPNAIFVDRGDNMYVTDFFADCSYRIDGLSGVINNNCGNGHQGDDGDGGDGQFAHMELPHGVWKDNMGNTYLADYGNNKIQMLEAGTNILHTLGGGHGMFGFSPSGTLVSELKVSGVNGICVDAAGNIYFSDLGNHVVRKIDASGRVRTVAGTGVSGYSGDGGSALSAKLSSPGCLFINDAGHLFICDEGANVVRVVDVNTGIIKTLAGNGTPGFSGDGGAPTSAKLNQPSGVWQDISSGVIYIADMGNNRVRMIVDAGYKPIKGTGVNNVTASSFNLFPNPTTATFNIVLGEMPQNATVEVYNLLGEKVYSQSVTGLHTTITMDQPAGVYSIMLKSQAGITSQKLVIAK